MKYIVSYQQPNNHLVDFELVIDNIKEAKTLIQQPAWRPGRYELGNFAKNVQLWAAFDENNKPLHFKKLNKDLWEVDTNSVSTLKIKYNYYSAQLDAGACWLDDTQLYINGVHCFMYTPDLRNKPCTLELKVPANYEVATSLKKLSKHTFEAIDFDDLVDSPFIASANLKHHSFEEGGTTFHLWFQGECKPDMERITKDFKAFTKEQIAIFKSFPVKEYHYLYQIVAHTNSHGVEHLANTVIAYGPGPKLMKDAYFDFLGVSSHELFHSWNVKAIRPIEMQPYDYTKENYSSLIYVAEGVTTYYGDLTLARGGAYTDIEFIEEIRQKIQSHLDNYGRFKRSLANSAFESWLDGYQAGIPFRKVNVYTEGCLMGMIMDLQIRHFTDSNHSLDDVMLKLYEQYGKTGKGYSENDYRRLCEEAARTSLGFVFDDLINGTGDYEPVLAQSLAYAGIELTAKPHSGYVERTFGMKTMQEGTLTKVSAVAPGSPAEKAGLAKDDELIALNSSKLEGNLNDLAAYFDADTVILTAFSAKKLKEFKVQKTATNWYRSISLAKKKEASTAEKAFYKSWLKSDFDTK